MNNISVTSVLLFAAGATLLYAAVKNKNPIDVIKTSVSGKSPSTVPTTPASNGTATSLNVVPSSASPFSGGITPV